MDNSKEIKKANRKALPKFILFIIVCMAVGGVIGYCAARFSLDGLSDTLKTAEDFFGMYIAPWVMVALAVAIPIVAIPLYKGAKKLLSTWDGENEEVSDAIDKKLSIIIWFTGAAFILSYFLIAASYSGGFATFDDKESTVRFFISIAALCVIMVETVLIQQRCIDTGKKTNPEKNVSVYDLKFQKKWIDSCDEAEKIMIGKCAFKAYGATNAACTALAVLLALCALVFNIGFLPSLAVCAVWFVNHTVYCKEALKYAKAGNKLS